MAAEEALRLDYDQTTRFLHALIDNRIKLLAFVPTIAGTAVGLLGEARPPAELLGVALIGLVATVGIFVYELRNAQQYDALVGRTQELERLLGLPSIHGLHGSGRGARPAVEPVVRARSRLGARLLGRDRRLELPGCVGLPPLDARRQRADDRRRRRARGRRGRRRGARASPLYSLEHRGGEHAADPLRG